MGEISEALKRINKKNVKCIICHSREVWLNTSKCYECSNDAIKRKKESAGRYRGTITADYLSFTGIHYDSAGSYSGRYVRALY